MAKINTEEAAANVNKIIGIKTFRLMPINPILLIKLYYVFQKTSKSI
jgi:hypothetical protein